MTGTSICSPRVTRESILAVAVCAPILSFLPLGIPVRPPLSAPNVEPLALADRKAGEASTGRVVYGTTAACLPREKGTHGVGVPTRDATFPGTGLPLRRWLPQVDDSVMEAV